MALAGALVWAVAAVICHQQPERSFFWQGQQLPICARCTGLYLSAIVAFGIWLMWRFTAGRPALALTPPIALRAMAIASLPTLVSWFSGAIGIWDGTNLTRAVLAIPLGATAGVLVAAVASKDLR